MTAVHHLLYYVDTTHCSATYGPIWMKFGKLMQNNMPITRIWSNTLKKHNRRNQATLVDPARKRSGLLYTGPGTTRARLPASSYARFLSPARGRRRQRTFQTRSCSRR